MEPTALPSLEPSESSVMEPTALPLIEPSEAPTIEPIALPSFQPSEPITLEPSALPSFKPSEAPTMEPTALPSFQSSESSSVEPTALPSFEPSEAPTIEPTALPSLEPSKAPTIEPTALPSFEPSKVRTIEPTSLPSLLPSEHVTLKPTFSPSLSPAFQPFLSENPSWQIFYYSENYSHELNITDTSMPTGFPIVSATLIPSSTSTFPPKSSSPSNIPWSNFYYDDRNYTYYEVNNSVNTVNSSRSPSASITYRPSYSTPFPTATVPSLNSSDPPTNSFATTTVPSRNRTEDFPTILTSPYPSVSFDPSTAPYMTSSPPSTSSYPTESPTNPPTPISNGFYTNTSLGLPTSLSSAQPLTYFPSLDPSATVTSLIPTVSSSGKPQSFIPSLSTTQPLELSPQSSPTEVPSAAPQPFPSSISSAQPRGSILPSPAPTRTIFTVSPTIAIVLPQCLPSIPPSYVSVTARPLVFSSKISSLASTAIPTTAATSAAPSRQNNPIVSFVQSVNMLVPGGCDALANDSLSQQTIAIATASSMQVDIAYVSYGGCSSGNSRRLYMLATSSSSFRHLASGTIQPISAINKVTVPLQLSSSTTDAQVLFSELQNRLTAAFSSGNFTRNLKKSSSHLGATLMAKVNVTSMGTTSAFVVLSPPTATPTAGPTTIASERGTQTAASIYPVALIAGLVGGLFGVFIVALAILYGWNYYVTISGSKVAPSSEPTTAVLVPPMRAFVRVRPLHTGPGADETTIADEFPTIIVSEHIVFLTNTDTNSFINIYSESPSS